MTNIHSDESILASNEYLRALQRQEVNDILTLYISEPNGLLLWQAITLLHEIGDPIPANLHAKLAEWGRKLQKTQESDEVVKILGLVGDEKFKRGPKRLAIAEKQRAIAGQVIVVMSHFKMTAKEAFEVVKKSYPEQSRLKTSYIKAAYNRFPDMHKRTRGVKTRSSSGDALQMFWGKSRRPSPE
jgi:hypothetical protein